MPQMAPMNWLFLYIFFFFILILFNFMTFYLFLIKNKYSENNIINTNNHLWKW
uniref:ATP synthase complex subunit 8 n=1 Tax=Deronectes angusi TaxID=156922 RepID=A0A894K082_9DYTI|nr:ATP synthase F0 subunit 8 [Deronectes angusi]